MFNFKHIVIGGAVLILVLITLFITFFINERTKEANINGDEIAKPIISNIEQEGRTQVNTETSEKNTTIGVYQNKLLGFSFNYPKSWGNADTIFRQAGQNEINTGKLAQIFFEKELHTPYISAYSQDLKGMYIDKGFKVLPSKNLCDLIPNDDAQLFRECRVVTVNGQEYAWVNVFIAPECSPFFQTNIYTISPNNEYKIIKFLNRFNTVTEQVISTYDCTSPTSEQAAIANAKIQSKNIFERTNLSPIDREDLNNLDNLIKTLTFTK